MNDAITRSGGAAVAVGGVDIEARNLTKRYGTGTAEVLALDNVDIAVPSGDAIALVGRSGSGKSTLLHLVGAMDIPTSGSLRVGDREVGELRGGGAAQYRRSIGFVFQGFHLLSALTVLDNVLAPLIPTRQARHSADRAAELLELVGLGGRFRALPSELSGGQQQRVAIARALVNQPQLVLADEPTGNLDSVTGGEVIDLLLSLRERFGTTLLLASHDQDVTARLDRTVHLVDGHIENDA